MEEEENGEEKSSVKPINTQSSLAWQGADNSVVREPVCRKEIEKAGEIDYPEPDDQRISLFLPPIARYALLLISKKKSTQLTIIQHCSFEVIVKRN